VSAGTRFEGFDTTADELVFAFPSPQGLILAMDVQQARVLMMILDFFFLPGIHRPIASQLVNVVANVER